MVVEQKAESPQERQVTDALASRRIYQPPEKGIHPAIPTAVVVTVVVVLIVVVYSMANSFSMDPNEPPAGCFCDGVVVTSNTTAEVDFGGFSYAPRPVDLKIVLASSSDSGTYTFGSNSDGTVLSLESGIDMGTIAYRDFSDDMEVDPGDMLMISGLSPSNYYSVKMLWKDGSTMDIENFETPA
ncbi:MAG: hypothetical protein JSV43_07825 [Methanobacteriota archaeon]|nr:MAG: hypothetical protein JSV43_07825 [Euryarchaeota archaeon]